MELSDLFRFEQCRALDAASIAAGLPEQQLMGQAALASLYALKDAGILAGGAEILILCGPGNNGGDGYALACMLAGRVAASGGPLADGKGAIRVRLFSGAPPKSAAARFYAQLLAGLAPRSTHATRISLHSFEEFLRLESSQLNSSNFCIIEALLGTGQNAAPRGDIAAVLQQIHRLRTRARLRVISLDLPVGLREDAAPARNDDRLVPDEIHSYGVDKAALRLDPEIAARSHVRVLPMGFWPPARQTASGGHSPDPVQPIRSLEYAGEDATALLRLTARDALSHKYQSGHGLLIGGSPGMEGALLMAARAFFATGGGILHAIVPDAESRRFLTTALPGVMFLDRERPLPDNLRPRAIAVGPGLAPADLESNIRLLETILAPAEYEPTLILDAGALPWIRDSRFPDRLRRRTVLTPHTGEWRRLGGSKIDCVAALLDAARLQSRESGCYALVKDAVSVLLGPDADSPLGIRHRPNAALAVAGSGDNLCGILLALFARRPVEKATEAANATASPRTPFELIAAALEILDRAARLEHHPRADQFPDLIRRALQADQATDSSQAGSTADREANAT